MPAPPDDGTSKEVQIALISSEAEDCSNFFHNEQLKDPALCPIMKYLSEGVLPEDTQVAAKVIVQASLYTVADGILYYTGQKKDSTPIVVVPCDYKKKLMEEYHAGVIMSGHFSGPRIYKTMSCQWWWEHMYQDIINYAHNCPQCAISNWCGKKTITSHEVNTS